MEKRPGLLGFDRTTALLMAVPGLVGFVATMGFATHSAISTTWPAYPTWASVTLSVITPLLFVLLVGVVGALHDTRAIGRREAANKRRE